MRRRLPLFALLVLAANCPTSDAATIHQGYSFSCQCPSILADVTLSRFDPALGRLDLVALMVDAHTDGLSIPYAAPDPPWSGFDPLGVYASMQSTGPDSVIYLNAFERYFFDPDWRILSL